MKENSDRNPGAPEARANFFLRRPVLSMVLSIFIVLAGLLSIRVLPVAQYPDLIPPTITVSAKYPGASPEVIAQTVATPIEEQINGVDGMIYMSSVSSASGSLQISVTFAVGTDADIAQVNVNNRVQAAEPMLPEIVRQYGVTVETFSPAILEIVALYSKGGRYDATYLSNYALIDLLDGLKRVPGVGQAEILGSRNYAMRIWLDPLRMAQLGISTSDVAHAVESQNAQYSLGSVGSQPGSDELAMTWQLETQGRLDTAEQFGNIILRASPEGGVLRLKDVGRVELGAESYDFACAIDGATAIPLAIFLAPGSNALDTAERVADYMEEQAKRFPSGMGYLVPYDTTVFVRLSVEEVVRTLVEAMLLVFAVVYLFLQDWRATLIPCIAVPISLVGTFAGVYLLDFSINTLTLFALVLAIGMVVDDAIVVLENVERVLRTHDISVARATTLAMNEVTYAVIAIVLVLCSVFIPVGFLGGLAGVMYRQFAVTIAIAVVISGVVALTLTPALCQLLLRQERREVPRMFRWFNRGFDRLTDGFTHAVSFFLHHGLLSFAVLILLGVGTVELFRQVPTTLVPEEDQGSLMCTIALPAGSALPQTRGVVMSVSEGIRRLPTVEHVLSLSGYDLINGTLDTSAGTLFIKLKPWDEREKMGISVEETLKHIYALGLDQPKGTVLPFNPPAIMGMSNTGGFEMQLQTTSGTPAELAAMAANFAAEAARDPALARVNSSFNVDSPRLFVTLDTEKAMMSGVEESQVFSMMGATIGSTYINDFNMLGRTFKVMMQADQDWRSLPDSMRSLYVTSSSGEQIPLTSLVSVDMRGGPGVITHFNGLLSAKITGSPAPGMSSGQAVAALEKAAASLPPGYSYAWSGVTYQEVETGSTDVGVLGLSLLMIFLILAAQYERWSLPLAVLSAVPFAVFGAILGNWSVGLSNDIYTQIAIITLLGLACKNAILIVEFAVDLRGQGRGLEESALEAARLRFRPIIMTSIAFILGCLPLVFSSGAGAASRVSIGVSVVCGMLAATILAPLLVPYFYVLVMRVSERFTGKSKEEKA
ncbi:MAG: multidrug efflux RND transporter permease subunit [Mailhella sp.]|nr:multidrug efflux RND transporter permease subunit [Mailhella sp.]